MILTLSLGVLGGGSKVNFYLTTTLSKPLPTLGYSSGSKNCLVRLPTVNLPLSDELRTITRYNDEELAIVAKVHAEKLNRAKDQ